MAAFLYRVVADLYRYRFLQLQNQTIFLIDIFIVNHVCSYGFLTGVSCSPIIEVLKGAIVDQAPFGIVSGIESIDYSRLLSECRHLHRPDRYLIILTHQT
jgi:hypothetical protein